MGMAPFTLLLAMTSVNYRTQSKKQMQLLRNHGL